MKPVYGMREYLELAHMLVKAQIREERINSIEELCGLERHFRAALEAAPSPSPAPGAVGLPKTKELAEAWNILAVLANTHPDNWNSKDVLYKEFSIARGRPTINEFEVEAGILSVVSDIRKSTKVYDQISLHDLSGVIGDRLNRAIFLLTQSLHLASADAIERHQAQVREFLAALASLSQPAKEREGEQP